MSFSAGPVHCVAVAAWVWDFGAISLAQGRLRLVTMMSGTSQRPTRSPGPPGRPQRGKPLTGNVFAAAPHPIHVIAPACPAVGEE